MGAVIAMCGIAGFTRFHGLSGGQSTLETMGEAIRHRGPDAAGTYLDDAVGLHHRRLSIIDLSPAGNQPMRSPCGRYVIVFNGEIYNYREQRELLEADGYPFTSNTDTEVILALYGRKGPDCLEDLNGMFALALWDRQEQRLFLARDRIGKKPLYYAPVAGDVVFASELKALLAAKLIERSIRLDALYDYFAYQYVPDPKTIFENVYKLEPGHWLEVSASGQNKEQYWDVSFARRSISEDEAREALRSHIDAATQRRMIADVSLGAFLSGGVDSSGIVATMAKLAERPVTTCAVGFDAARFDETEFAQVVATHCGTDHHEFTVGNDITASLAEIVVFFDEPFADPSLVPTFFVSRLARQQVTVALAGDGGDEVFAGYRKYRVDAIENRLREHLPMFVRRHLCGPLSRLLGSSASRLLRRAATLLDALSKDPALAFFQSNAQITDAQWEMLSTPETRRLLGDYHPSRATIDAYTRCDGPDHLSRILYTDMKTYLPGDILVKVDRMSMAHALEVRAPLLDYELVNFAASLPSELKLCGKKGKYLLKKVFSEGLPDGILDRRKMGFTPPVAEWLRRGLKSFAEKKLLGSSGGLPRYLKVEAIEKLWAEHQAGDRDHSALLWSLLMFQIWWDKYMEEA